MSVSNEWTEWHLTLRGWEEGSTKTDAALKESAPPEDRVLIMKYHEYLSSRFSKADVGTKEVWSSSDTLSVTTLLAHFGKCPNHL